MKPSLIAACFVAATLILLLLLWPRPADRTSTSDVSKVAVAAVTGDQSVVVSTQAPGHGAPDPMSTSKVVSQRDYEAVLASHEAGMAQAAREFNQKHNLPVAFYGQVVDQDDRPLPNAHVTAAVLANHVTPDNRDITQAKTQADRATRGDGRFEITDLTGDSVNIDSISKEGYEVEPMARVYNIQSGSVEQPTVFRMWSTNIHEPLIAGEKSFVVIPDGRRYAIDLLKGTISEGDQGDLVAWIKRPDPVDRGQRYDWSCEVAMPGGGLAGSDQYGMFRAPEGGYTNVFEFQERANVDGWGGSTGDKRFYVQLHNGQMYGRIVVQLYADYHGKQPGMIRLSYAVNPSGSRLLR